MDASYATTKAIESAKDTSGRSLSSDRPEGKDYTVQRLLIGTHTSDNDQNYLQIAQVQLPSDSNPIDTRKFDDERGGKGVSIQASVRCRNVFTRLWGLTIARTRSDDACLSSLFFQRWEALGAQNARSTSRKGSTMMERSTGPDTCPRTQTSSLQRPS